MLEEYIVQPIEKKMGLGSHAKKKEIEGGETSVKDHPLNFSHESKWQNYFKDVELWKLIEKDVKRTRKSCTFFSESH